MYMMADGGSEKKSEVHLLEEILDEVSDCVPLLTNTWSVDDPSLEASKSLLTVPEWPASDSTVKTGHGVPDLVS